MIPDIVGGGWTRHSLLSIARVSDDNSFQTFFNNRLPFFEF